MPDKNVEVPGLGVVSFPDSMSDDQINSAIKAQLNPPETQAPSTGLAQGKVPNARIRNLPNPAEGMSPGRALYEGAKTGLTAASLPAMAGSPISALRAIAGGTAGNMIGKGIATAGGAGEFGQEVAGDVGSLVGAGALEGLFQTGKSSLAGKIFTPEGELTELGKAVAHPADKGGEYALRRLFGFDPDAQASHELFVDKVAEAEKARQKELSQFGRLRTLDEAQQAREARLAAKNATKSNPFSGMTSTTPAEVQTMQKPALMDTIPQGSPTPFKVVSKFEPTPAKEPSRIIQPGSAEAMPKAVKGSYWSFPKENLLQAAKTDRDAAQIYTSRFGPLPPNYRYLTDIASAKNKGLYRSGEE